MGMGMGMGAMAVVVVITKTVTVQGSNFKTQAMSKAKTVRGKMGVATGEDIGTNTVVLAVVGKGGVLAAVVTTNGTTGATSTSTNTSTSARIGGMTDTTAVPGVTPARRVRALLRATTKMVRGMVIPERLSIWLSLPLPLPLPLPLRPGAKQPTRCLRLRLTRPDCPNTRKANGSAAPQVQTLQQQSLVHRQDDSGRQLQPTRPSSQVPHSKAVGKVRVVGRTIVLRMALGALDFQMQQ